MGTLQFIGWLKFHLDRRTFEGCVWVNKEQQMFKILWPRADKNLTPDKLGVMFKWWTHKFGNTRNHNQPTAIKGNFRSCLNSKVQSKEIKKLKTMENRSDGDDWKVFQFTENLKDNVRNPPGHKKSKQQRNMIADPTESPTSFGWSYPMGSDTPTIKVEMTDDPLENMKKGGLKQGLKVLVNNQPYMSNNQLVKTSVESSIYDSPSHHDIISPKTSPTIQVPKVRPQLPVEPMIRIQEPPPPYNDMKQLINAQNFHRMMENKLPGPPLIPVINSSRSLSEAEAKSLLEDINRGNNTLLRSPSALMPGNPLINAKPLVPPELLSEYSRLGIFNPLKIQDILKDVLTRKRLLEDPDPLEKEAKVHDTRDRELEKNMGENNRTETPNPVVSDSDTDTLPSFLQYIGKELETLPYDCQEKAKKEIFRVISDLKKQSVMFMVPHHWQLANMAATRQQ